MRDLPTPEAPEGATFAAELQIWLSPSFPVGSFAYSQGLEWAVADGRICGRESLSAWLTALLRHGALRNDLIVLSLVRRAATDGEVCALAELAAALQPSRERAEEALQQGWSFLEAYRAAWATGPEQRIDLANGAGVTLPVAVGLASRAHGLDLPATLMAFGTAFLTNLVSAAIRLGAIGQFDGQACLAAALPDLRDVCTMAACASTDDLGGATFSADLASMLHETQGTRLFRS